MKPASSRAKPTSKKKKKPLKFKSDGSLRKAAGTTKAGKLNETKTKQIAKGKGAAAKKARFYLNVLKK